MCPHPFCQKNLGWPLLVAISVAGCSSRPSESVTPNGSNSAASSAENDGRPTDRFETRRSDVALARLLSREEVDEIREAIERSGGTLDCDDREQPVAIDFLATRASTDLAAWQAVLRCSNLSRLRIRAGGIAPQDLASLRQLENLELLHVEDAPVSDALLREWGPSLGRLKQLSLRNTPSLTDEGVAELARLPRLQSLALIDQQIRGKALQSLTQTTQLSALDLRMCHQIQVQDLAALAAMPKLVELKLGGYSIDDDHLAAVAQLPNLKSLTVEDAAFRPAGLRQFADGRSANSLEQLAFTRCAALTDDACEALGAFPRLRALLLRDVPVTGEFLQKLPTRAQWERLSLSQTYVTTEALEALKECHQLRVLDLSRTYLNREMIDVLRDLPRLELLDMSDCGLTDEMVLSLVSPKRIKTLKVDGNPGLSPTIVKQMVEP